MCNLSKFAEMLGDAMFEKNLNSPALAKELGISRNTLTRYLQGVRFPSVNMLVKIADYFGCSTDYLLGYDSIKRVTKFLPCPPFSERIKFLLKSKEGYTGYLFCKEAKISESNFYDWKNGKREPSVDNVVKIAKFLDCSVDYVLGREA
ncbi:MAG: helix-turn-helix domain-containing protein [Clostridia bacterium]|nr:helix-turn-helix domain-containing protein [Clostridia bacterium]